jgi:hypothetical protein
VVAKGAPRVRFQKSLSRVICVTAKGFDLMISLSCSQPTTETRSARINQKPSAKRGYSMRKTVYLAMALVALLLTGRTADAQALLFFNAHTNLCLGPENNSPAQGTPIVQESCSGSPEWIALSDGAGVQFQNGLSGMCLDARGGAANHTPVQQWPCNGISNERWKISGSGGTQNAPVQSMVAGSNGFCLDIPGGQTTVGLAMQIYVCNNTVSQLWQLRLAGNEVVVPNFANAVNSGTLAAAENEIKAFGFVLKVNSSPNCFEGHSTIGQTPIPGTTAPVKSTVTITMFTCTKPG